MTLRSQDYAWLADHCYDRKGDLAQLVNQTVELGGVEYKVLAVADKDNGYQGAIYQRTDTGEIVVAHRGTEPDRELLQDAILTDGGMIANRSNRQAEDAIALTRQAREYAMDPNIVSAYGRVPEVTVTGHSLGGALAQITAHHFGLKGETFNAYGAASLDFRIPEGGSDVINHVMGHDAAGAASPHYGQTRVYANAQAIDTLHDAGYANNRSPLDLRSAVSAAKDAFGRGSHDMHNFLPVDGTGRPDRSILDDPQARVLAAQYDPMIDKYRGDVERTRSGLTRSLRGPAGALEDAVDWLRGDLPAGEPARRETQGDRPRASNDMRDADHPANGKYRQAYSGVVEIDQRLGRTPDGASERLAASLTAAGAGLSSIDQVVLNRDGSRAFAVEGRGPVEARGRVQVDVAEAVQRPVEASTQDWQAATQRLAAQQQEQLAREQAPPTVRGPTMA